MSHLAGSLPKGFRIGVAVSGSDAVDLLRRVEAAEAAGVEAAWLTSGGVVPDPIAILAAAATSTSSMLLGTSIVPLLPRHPLAMWQSALAVHQLSRGRFRLGIGPSTKRVATHNLGVAWPDPHVATAEYLTVLRQLADTGRADFAGRYYTVRDRASGPAPIPLYLAALRKRAFQLAGRLADGAISWVAPWRYLADTGLPALGSGASDAGKEPPALIVHVPVALTHDVHAARDAFRRQLGIYPRIAEYARMYRDLGFVDLAGQYSDALIDELIVWGDAEAIREGLERVGRAGATEVLVTPLDIGGDSDPVVRILGQISRHRDDRQS